MCRLISLDRVIEKVRAGTESGTYGTVCHTGTSLAGSKPYCHFFSEKHHIGMSQEQRITMLVNAISRGVWFSLNPLNYTLKLATTTLGRKKLWTSLYRIALSCGAKAFRCLEPFRSGSRAWRTDGQTEPTCAENWSNLHQSSRMYLWTRKSPYIHRVADVFLDTVYIWWGAIDGINSALIILTTALFDALIARSWTGYNCMSQSCNKQLMLQSIGLQRGSCLSHLISVAK